jgi:hypothetical protein
MVIEFDWLLCVATLGDAGDGEEKKWCFHDDTRVLCKV